MGISYDIISSETYSMILLISIPGHELEGLCVMQPYGNSTETSLGLVYGVPLISHMSEHIENAVVI